MNKRIKVWGARVMLAMIAILIILSMACFIIDSGTKIMRVIGGCIIVFVGGGLIGFVVGYIIDLVYKLIAIAKGD